ncbi:CheB methylesterase domain-containing protein [Yoonia sp.]|uniref:CheB methylesterase domain-containing protein n=1 Tax=Yoonia sp. TaxID=2212373 RepID=UPI0025CD152B|nr:CheB methylesterase domain-containing protein [Yoonia sp.]
MWPPATDDYNRQRHSVDPFRIVLIGSSTGGVDALLRIISGFPADCPPTLIVQHTGGSYARSLIRLLDGATPAKVLPAQNGQNLSRGEIYLAPDDMAHLQLCPSRSRQILLKPGPPVSGHRPSVDALFQSALDYADEITAALLTGMGRDGAAGITALRRAGARTIGQDAATSVVYGMPRVAKQMGGIETELPLSMIGPALLQVSRTTVAT